MNRFAGATKFIDVPLRIRGGRPAPDRRQWVIRPDDLLVLAFDLVNLQVQLSANAQQPAQLVKKGPRQAYLSVTFPPQHLIEKAYFTTTPEYPVTIPLNAGQVPPLDDKDAPPKGHDEDPDAPPIDAIVSGWSRLVFHVPDDYLPVDWTLDGLLKAMRDLQLSVPANALPPKAPRPRFRELISSALDQSSLISSSIISALGGTASVRPPASAMSVVDQSAAFQAFAAPAMAGTTRVYAVARNRRKVRTIGNALGLTMVTGSASKDLFAKYAIDVTGHQISPYLLRPDPAPPGANQTALELPYRVILSPNRYGAWFHVDEPQTSIETGHTELWHTRLGTRPVDGVPFEGDDPLLKLRAVWTTDPPAPTTPAHTNDPVDIPDHDNFPWRMSLDTFDRHNIVHLSSNFRLTDPKNAKNFYEPQPLDVDHLHLSSLGAWLDSRGVWDFPQPKGLSVEEWRHRATLGRDHYVRVVYAGHLFPFGHRASIVKITERRFHDDKPGNPAYLRQQMFLVPREMVRTYRTSGLKYDGPDAARLGEQYDLMMPFESVRIMNKVSPLLDPPEDDDIDNKKQGAFWPRVGGQPFKFHLIATDTDGNPVDLSMPLIFVGKEETDIDSPPSIIPLKVKDAYETAVWPPASANLRATVPLNGQKVAFAESDGPDDTAFAVQSLTFGAEVPSDPKYNSLPFIEPRYWPVIRKAQIDVPSLQRIARTTAPATMVYQDLFLRDGFEGGNAGQVFLAADPAVPKLGVGFSSQGDRSGGIVTPDLSLSGLSRITGPVSGDVNTAANGSFTPSAWFGALAGAKLFGVLKLTDILDHVGFDELEKLPQFAGQGLNQVEQLISALDRLKTLATANPVPETSAVSFVLDQLLNPSTGSIPALLGGGGIAPVTSQLATLKGELATLAGSVGGSALPAGPKALVVAATGSVAKSVDGVLATAGILQQFADGDVLPKAMNARFDWRPVLKPSGPFKPSGTRNLLLSVEAADALQGANEETFTVTCSLDNFDLDLEVLILHFERVLFQARAGKKPDVDVAFTGFEFIGPLSFVETLREVIPFDGFSDPPDIQVTPSGITAGFSMGLPNLSIGVFSLENLSLAAGFDVPFVGPPMSTWFRFCERENPARLTVSLFGGGFYFGVTVNADGLQILEGAIEFGAACSVDFGVASGSVSAMAGLYFKIEGPDFTLAGYFRLRGAVEALGIVSVCIELYLEMRYESASGKCVGTATLSIEIDVALFSTTIEISCTKKFAGSGADPTFAELMDVAPDATSPDWNAYCAAFA